MLKKDQIEAVKTFLRAWDALPVGHHMVSEVQDWLKSEELKRGVAGLRQMVKEGDDK